MPSVNLIRTTQTDKQEKIFHQTKMSVAGRLIDAIVASDYTKFSKILNEVPDTNQLDKLTLYNNEEGGPWDWDDDKIISPLNLSCKFNKPVFAEALLKKKCQS